MCFNTFGAMCDDLGSIMLFLYLVFIYLVCKVIIIVLQIVAVFKRPEGTSYCSG